MIDILIANPLLLLFVVSALGFALGRIRIAGVSLGIAAVLFAGLGVGALHPDLKLPEIIYLIGLVLFVYTVGLSSGAGFFASFRRKGLRDNLFVLALLLVAAGLTLGIRGLLGLKPTVTAGMFAGSLTNTPTLAAILDAVKAMTPAGALDQALAEPVVGYSIAYPMGFLGMMLAMTFARRLWPRDEAREAAALRELGVSGERLVNRTVQVTQPDVVGVTIQSLMESGGFDVVLGRMRRGEHLDLASGQVVLQLGDLISVVGAQAAVERFTQALGEASQVELPLDRSEMDYRRIFVSNPRLVGHRLRDLNLPQQFGAIITRVRRGDIEMLPHADTVLELGDRVRVVTHRDHMEAVTRFFGDSYRALSEIDILSFNLGLALGLLVGLIPIPLPGGVVVRLGYAGGPLIVALVLGALRRTGPIVWNLPYNANLTLRQVGLILFLAGVGTRAGYAFVSTLTGGGGLTLFLAGIVITGVTAFLTLWLGYSVLKMPVGLLFGVLSGLQTNPAVLSFALEQTDNDLPNVGYATVYPVATIAKIVLAQLMLTLLK
ncbi:MAG: transporter [Anaerolineae bacterium]|nr:transporter [Anaerolineae bacterium]